MKAWKPYVFIYTQSQADSVVDELQPFLKHGGEIVRLQNAGRESHVYLQHITRNYKNLANHTLFTQDAPNTDLLPKKFEVSHTLVAASQQHVSICVTVCQPRSLNHGKFELTSVPPYEHAIGNCNICLTFSLCREAMGALAMTHCR